ncbi:PAAR domain-containing protein [Deinococcus sp.]|uniref:PAAR domain-containing protein n=1 Tax=Deinococcus sp. TaxID=47478 RepID=UPI003B5BB29E
MTQPDTSQPTPPEFVIPQDVVPIDEADLPAPGMAQPAIRLGDPGSHLGTTSTGEPTVLIGGLPAACVGDTHIEPFHGSQVISLGSLTVLIGGRPAARAGDQVSCLATLIPSQLTVLIGS